MLDDLVRTLFPPRCLGCGRPGEVVCSRCAAELVAPPACIPLRGVDVLIAPFSYDGLARELVARVKYRNHRAAVPWLAEALALSVRSVLPCADRLSPGERHTTVTWVPTTATRRRARGFDHAELLGRSLARRLRLPSARLLVRLDATPQTGRDARARRSAAPTFAAAHSRPTSHSVILVDDVMTTGATLASAASTLRAAGYTEIVGAVAARRL